MILLMTGMAFAQDSKGAAISSQDKSFVKDAAMGGMFEVKMGQVAANQGASDAVKSFGQRMVDDHGKLNTELMDLAKQKGLAVPAEMDKKFQKKVDSMSKKSGADFDRAYIKDMVKDHQDDIKAFEKEAKKGKDPDIKAFAAKTLPTLQEHLKLAQQIESQMAAQKK
jgi:putative membrane protein